MEDKIDQCSLFYFALTTRPLARMMGLFTKGLTSMNEMLVCSE